MQSERSIILAVVSAKNDYANQIVIELAKKFDPKGLRTMGIITKPDTLIPGSENKASFRCLARNEEVAFRLGWHVLRNRDYHTKNSTAEQRDQEEKEFFSSSTWSSLPPDILGIDLLKPRLSIVLKNHIISVLPSLIKDVKQGINDCIVDLGRLGDSRRTLPEQRLYLVRVSQRFSTLIKAAVDGAYSDAFFGDPMTPDGESKRLRAVIQNRMLQFAKELRKNGHRKIIIDTSDENFNHPVEKVVRRSDYLDHVHDLIRKTRGRELPGTFNPMVIGDFFFEQSQPWKSSCDLYCQVVHDAIHTSLKHTIDTVTDITTAEVLFKDHLSPALGSLLSSFHTKVSEILEPHQQGHAITYNHYFTETVQKARKEWNDTQLVKCLQAYFGASPDQRSIYVSQKVDFPSLIRSIPSSSEMDMDRHACSEAMYCMQAYYKASGWPAETIQPEINNPQVAMKTLIDNFCVLAVEKCLLSDLANILSPDVVMKLSDDAVKTIAAESDESVHERRFLIEKTRTLREGLAQLERLYQPRSSGTSAAQTILRSTY